ncbi:MAG TPA: type II secretion system protein [Kiritimatiellia bacterium]|nr:type II secretion system protein [Kiritimatiellia bacterium]HPS06345.1 type II secretion system protein [Kiritimatiellia bacterium]
MRNGRTQRADRHGFSLLELLAVMSIMAMLSALAVTSYFSAIRGMARRSAVKHLVNTLVLARQRACLEGSRISVVIYNAVSGYDKVSNEEIVVPSYVVCKEIGKISYQASEYLIDEFASLDKIFGSGENLNDLKEDGERNSIRVYNLTNGGWWEVYPKVMEQNGVFTDRASALEIAKNPAATVKYDIPAFAFVKNKSVANPNEPSSWEVNDAYGIEAAPVNSLPRGFWFEKLKDKTNKGVICFTFLPDGTAIFDSNNANGEVVLEEMEKPNKTLTIRVEKTDGSINYKEQWT